MSLLISQKICLLCSVMVVLVSCQSRSISTTTEEQQTTISFAVHDHQREIYETFAQQFMTEQPEVRVVIISSDELIQQLLAQNPQPDSLTQSRWILAHADTTFAGNLTELSQYQLILNLLPLMAADASFDKTDFYPQMLEQYMTRQSLWALPRYRAIDLLSYNRDLFEQFDVPFPELGWTWHEMHRAAEQLARQENGQIVVGGLLATLGSAGGLLGEVLRLQGVDFGRLPPDQVHFQREDLQDAIAYIQRLQTTGALIVSRELNPDVEPLVDSYELYQSGRLGMWGSGVFTPRDNQGNPLDTEVSFTVGTVAYPADEHYFGAIGEGYVVSAGTVAPQASWQWIEFLSRQPVVFETTSIAGTILVPARRSVAEATHFWERFDADTAEAVRWSMAHATGEADRPHYTQALNILSKLAFDLFDQPELDAQDLIATAQQQFETEVAQTLLTPTPEVPDAQLVVATPQPTIDRDQRTVITFAAHGRSYTTLRHLIKPFHTQQANVFIQLQGSAHTGTTSTIDGLAQTSDCFMWAGTFPEKETQLVLDLQPLLNVERRLLSGAYPARFRAPYQWQGGVYGLPYTVQLRALHYQADLFTVAGISNPGPEWTSDDFLAAAQALTVEISTEKRYGYVSYSGVIPDLLFFIQQNGGELLRRDGDHLQPDFHNPIVISAINWYFDLHRVHGVMPALNTVVNEQGGGNETAWNLVRNGQAGMWFGPSTRMFNTDQDQTETPFDAALAPLPIGNTGLHTSDMHIQSLHISAQTEHPQACWEWLVFLINNSQIMTGPGIFPAHITVTQGGDPIDSLSSPEQHVFETYVSFLANDDQSDYPYIPIDMQSPVLQWFFQALHRVITEDANLTDQLVAAEQATALYIDCIAGGIAEDECVAQATKLALP